MLVVSSVMPSVKWRRNDFSHSSVIAWPKSMYMCLHSTCFGDKVFLGIANRQAITVRQAHCHVIVCTTFASGEVYGAGTIHRKCVSQVARDRLYAGVTMSLKELSTHVVIDSSETKKNRT